MVKMDYEPPLLVAVQASNESNESNESNASNASNESICYVDCSSDDIGTETIDIRFNAAQKKYDGEKLTATYSYICDSFDNYTVEASWKYDNAATEEIEILDVIVDAGAYLCVLTDVRVFLNGKEVDYDGNIIYSSGEQTISRREVTLKSGDATKKYDGTPLVCNDVAILQDGFADGEGADFTVTGAQTDIGVSENTFTYQLTGNTKAENYEIKTLTGSLTVCTGLEINVSGNPENWAKFATLEAEFRNEGGTVTTQEYSFDNEQWQNYTQPVKVDANGIVYFRATDGQGETALMSVEVTKIDAVAPTINVSGNPENWVKSATLAATFTDKESGIDTAQYSLNNQDWTTYTGAITVGQNGTVYFQATDKVGNVGTERVEVTKIDAVAPTINVSGNPENWVKSATLTATFTDKESGVDTRQYSLNNKDWTTYTGAITIKQNGTVYFRATDKVGNVSEIKSVKVTTVDAVAPTVTVSGNPTKWVKSAKLTATFKDDLSGIKSQQYSTDNKTWKSYSSALTVTKNVTYYFKATDNAGNTKTTNVKVTTVDAVVPTVTVSGNPTKWVKSAKLTATFKDDLSGIKLKQYSTDNKTWKTYSSALTVTQNATYYFKATDNAGNTKTTSVKVTKVDAIAPTISVTSSPSGWTKSSSVKLTATFKDDLSGVKTKQYSTDNKTWKTYSAAITVKKHSTVYFKSSDNLGNTSTKAVEVKIDTTAPTVTVSGNPSKWTKSSVKLTAAFKDDLSGIKSQQYSTDKKTWKTYSAALTVTKNATYYFRATDNAGNVSAVKTVKVTKIDKTKPTVSVKASTTAWTKSNVSLTATFTDKESGIKSKQYSLNNKDWKTYSKAVTISKNQTVYFRATDNAGNVSAVKSVKVSKIDKVAPTVSVSGNPTKWTKSSVKLTAAFKDDLSGVKTKQYSTDKKTWKTYSKAISVTKNATYYFRATDNAGNVSEVKSVKVSKIDKVAPTVSVSGNPTKWTKSSVKLTATFKDDLSDVKTKQYSTDNKTWKTYSSALTVTKNATYYFRATDNAGNVSAVKTVKVTKIDKIAPLVAVKANTSAWTKSNVSLTATFTDKESGIKSKQYSLNNKDWKTYSKAVTVSKNQTVYFRATDNAGNVTTGIYEVKNIDKTNPAISVSGNPKTWVKSAKLTATFTDKESGIKSQQYSTDNKTWKSYSSPLTVTKNATYYFKATDNAGNTTTKSVKVTKVGNGDNSNDTWQKATAITENSVSGWVGIGDLADYYKFATTEKAQLKFDFDAATGQAVKDGKLNVVCLDANGKNVSLVWDGADFSTKSKVAAGSYILGVTDPVESQKGINYTIAIKK